MADTPIDRHARHRIRRHPERGSHERDRAYAILDSAQIAHVGFAVDGQPFVIPMLYARQGERVLLHGGVSSRLMQHLASGAPCTLAVTHLDGWVLARSHFHHSVNYRSVVIFGRARVIDEPVEKAAALAHLVDALIPGRAADTRPSDPQELAATVLLAVEIEDLSVKVREGDPKDHPDDLASAAWAGVIPLSLTPGTPIPAPDLATSVRLPGYLRAPAGRT
jgi:nitroimidazol reductase NimA-like FMN-containing flavoprotein (pyridoxamine 5'-phosphate oxidase superfamily)